MLDIKYLLCSCSSDKIPGSTNDNRLRDDPFEKPAYDTIFSWSQSFENLMRSTAGQRFFGEFLKSEYSDENILFWCACEELKKETNIEKIEEKARIIYEDFISILSPKEVSVDARIRDLVNSNMTRPDVNSFDEAQAQIVILMQRDSYPRFLSSALYRKLLGARGQIEDA